MRVAVLRFYKFSIEAILDIAAFLQMVYGETSANLRSLLPADVIKEKSAHEWALSIVSAKDKLAKANSVEAQQRVMKVLSQNDMFGAFVFEVNYFPHDVCMSCLHLAE